MAVILTLIGTALAAVVKNLGCKKARDWIYGHGTFITATIAFAALITWLIMSFNDYGRAHP